MNICTFDNINPALFSRKESLQRWIFLQKLIFLHGPQKRPFTRLQCFNVQVKLSHICVPQMLLNKWDQSTNLLDVYSGVFEAFTVGRLEQEVGWGLWRPDMQHLSWGRFQTRRAHRNPPTDIYSPKVGSLYPILDRVNCADSASSILKLVSL